jgi:magnesium-transporting ATPase (P-type)
MAEATRRGERVLLLACGPETGDLAVIGILSFADPLREGVAEAIASCRAAGVRVVMLTGDHRDTAHSIANLAGLGVSEDQILEGRQLDGLTDPAIREALSRNSVIARVDPQQKLRVVSLLRAGGEVVVVTGDGINDAPALRSADVGVAMGLRGAEVAKQASDIIIADDHFATIVAAIEEGRSIRANIRRFISYVFTSNVAEMTPFLVYILFPVPLPLAVIQALAIDIGTDLLPALALGTERPSPREMTVPPEPPGRPLMTRVLGLRTFLFFGCIEAALGLVGFFSYYLESGWRFDSFAPYEALHSEATTVTFLAIVGGQVGCLFAQRDGAVLQRFDLRTNSWITCGLLFEILMALTLVYLPGVNTLFSMKPVDPLWLLVLPACFLVFTALDQLRRLRQDRGQARNAPLF